jgi:hypothetical protein
MGGFLNGSETDFPREIPHLKVLSSAETNYYGSAMDLPDFYRCAGGPNPAFPTR